MTDLVVACIWIAMIAIVVMYMVLSAVRSKLEDRKEQTEQKQCEDREKIFRLVGKVFVVRVRTQQDKKTDMETVLVGSMVDLGLRVIEKKADTELPSDTVEISGVFNIRVHDYSVEYTLDMRAVSSTGEIRAARHFSEESMREVAIKTLLYLSEALK